MSSKAVYRGHEKVMNDMMWLGHHFLSHRLVYSEDTDVGYSCSLGMNNSF